MSSINLSEHWDAVYTRQSDSQLGWYETCPETTLKLIDACQLPASAQIMIAGAGTSTLPAHLIERGYKALTLCDLSAVALEKQKIALGSAATEITCWLSDLSQTDSLPDSTVFFDLWQDRAVFHFLIEECERSAYLTHVQKKLKPGGFLLLACFAPGTARRCSGLPVRQYAIEDLQNWLGSEFVISQHLSQTHLTPTHQLREFTYALFQRQK